MEKDDQHTGPVVSFKDTQNKKKKILLFWGCFWHHEEILQYVSADMADMEGWKDEWMESKLLFNIMWTPVVVFPWVNHIDIIAFVKRQV